jgi:ATP-dependent Zn protease
LVFEPYPMREVGFGGGHVPRPSNAVQARHPPRRARYGGRMESRVKRVSVGIAALVPAVALAQQVEPQSSPVYTALATWLPFLFLIGLWWFFMRRMTVFGSKGGYREYMRVTQERMERIEIHLADIASSLRKIADDRKDSSR